MNALIAATRIDIEQRIHTFRKQRVMLDSDLATLYGVSTKALNQAVKRNVGRFPDDFMFQLGEEEVENLRSQKILEKPLKNRLRSQSVTSSSPDYGGRRYLPYAFTEQGVAMLSSVLASERAIHVNISIMRTFVRLRRIVQENNELARKLRMLEEKYDMQLRVVFEALDAILSTSVPRKKKPFGFSAD
jgi:hypothetical protein